jgi:CDP-glucose 4,6-dehydratase
MLGGSDPYSASKSSQDIIAKSYKVSFFKKNKNLIIIRAGNIIGGGDFELTRLIPDLYNCISKKKKLILRNSKAIRPWQHVLDVVNSILFIILKTSSKINSRPIIYNVGPNIKSNISVIKLIKAIKKINTKIKFYEKNKIKFNEIKQLKLSNKLIKNEINWKPLLDIEQTIILTNNWYNQYYKNKKTIFDFTINQIKKVLKLT